MPTAKPESASDDDRRLLRLFQALGPDDRRTLLAFAEFLAAGGQRALPCAPPQAPAATPPDPEREPAVLPRPAQETVIAAIRRLTQTYAMLDRGPLLHETAALMSAHVLQGRAAAAVIDDLEELFRRRFEDYRTRRDDGAGGA